MSEGFADDFVHYEESDISSNENLSAEHLPDSAVYLQKLENKLMRLKKGKKDLKSKDMLSVLESVREDQMSRLNMSNDETAFLPDSDVDDKQVSNSYIERKLFPQKNALTYEELQHLLEADVLAKLSMDNSTASDKTVDR